MKNNSGFSLVELMIVVAIIGVIGAIAMPSYESYMKKSRRADAKVGLSKAADFMERSYLKFHVYPAYNQVSDKGYYSIVASGVTTAGYDLTASAIATEDQITDTTTGAGDCTEMGLDSTGLRTAAKANDPLGNIDAIPDCW